MSPAATIAWARAEPAQPVAPATQMLSVILSTPFFFNLILSFNKEMQGHLFDRKDGKLAISRCTGRPERGPSRVAALSHAR
jgi:hypothetical protein